MFFKLKIVMEFPRALFQHVGSGSRHFRTNAISRKQHDGLFHGLPCAKFELLIMQQKRLPQPRPKLRAGSLRGQSPKYRAAGPSWTHRPATSPGGKFPPAPHHWPQIPNRAGSSATHYDRNASPSPANLPSHPPFPPHSFHPSSHSPTFHPL